MIKRYYVYEMDSDKEICFTNDFNHALSLRNSFNDNNKGLRYSIKVKYMKEV